MLGGLHQDLIFRGYMSPLTLTAANDVCFDEQIQCIIDGSLRYTVLRAGIDQLFGGERLMEVACALQHPISHTRRAHVICAHICIQTFRRTVIYFRLFQLANGLIYALCRLCCLWSNCLKNDNTLALVSNMLVVSSLRMPYRLMIGIWSCRKRALMPMS